LRIIFIFDADDDGNIDKEELLFFIKELFRQREEQESETATKVEAFKPITDGYVLNDTHNNV
jgi:Ca2+-binding EF-hand superfamily protein